nr:MAG TPA: hypothetical protein [Caudoviricetes sp.]
MFLSNQIYVDLPYSTIKHPLYSHFCDSTTLPSYLELRYLTPIKFHLYRHHDSSLPTERSIMMAG